MIFSVTEGKCEQSSLSEMQSHFDIHEANAIL